MLETRKGKYICLTTQILAIYYWMCYLLSSDSYYSVIILVGMAGMFSCGINAAKQMFPKEGRERKVTFLFSFVLATAVVAANYAMFTESEGIWWCRGLSAVAVFLGGMSAFWNILVCLSAHLSSFSFKKESTAVRPSVIFALSAAPMVTVNMLLLFMSEYPGNLTEDSMWQIGQLLTGVYSNHHPFYHTMLIGVFLKAGYVLFGDLNAAVAVYSVFQVLFIAGCFSYGMVTLYQAGIPVKYMVVCSLFYTLMPFHMIYSFSMWKDILFSGFVLLFTVSVFRLLADIGRIRTLNVFLCFLGSAGMCLFRSNGLFAYVLASAGFAVLFWKKHRRLCFSFLIIAVVSFLLKHPLLAALQVVQPDMIESLSIPAQQIARVVVECDDLTAEQRDLLNEVVDVDAIPETYAAFFSDPLKELVRQRDNQSFLTEHKGDFIKLYIELGLSHPVLYVEAWIDQTRGFWNGGYSNWKWFQGITNNDYGLRKDIRLERLHSLFGRYLSLYEESRALVIFLCIGFYVWLVGVVSYISLMRRDRTSLFLTFPTLAVVLSLLIATPVFSEFRYSYVVFCVIPFLILAPFADRMKTAAAEQVEEESDEVA